MDIGNTIQELIEAYSAGAWLVFSVVLLQATIYGLKKIKAAWEPAKPYAKPVIITLSAVVGVLGTVVGGLTPFEAIIIFSANGLSPFIHDLADHFNILPDDKVDDEKVEKEKD